jgi:hypothetical protein
MAYRYTKRKTPYSKMPLEKLKQIEADIHSKNPDLLSRLNLYYEEEKTRKQDQAEYNKVQSRIVAIRDAALKRKEREYTKSGFLKKLFIDKTGLHPLSWTKYVRVPGRTQDPRDGEKGSCHEATQKVQQRVQTPGC